VQIKKGSEDTMPSPEYGKDNKIKQSETPKNEKVREDQHKV
jgi:hypothetical protein